jgi:hypothetical protein
MTLDKIWRLLTAIFILVAAIALIGIAFVFQNAMISVIALYPALICVLWGLIKGIIVIVKHLDESAKEE